MKVHLENFSWMKVVRFLVVFVIFVSNINLIKAQQGCTDPQANNFDEAAMQNDGSCLYDDTDYTPICLSIFQEELNECSGLQYIDNKLYAINDGGGGPQILEIDSTNGLIVRSIWVENSINIDWEDMTHDDDFLYIGDFGNNFGIRTDLKIYKIPKSELGSDTVNAEEITFSYADQVDFTPQNRNNDYDCEALFAFGDSLYLFSKNWVDNKTRMYVLPKSGNNISVEPTNVLVRAQIEGLTFQSDDEGFIGGEDFSFVEGKLSHFKTLQWIENPSANNNFVPEELLHLYPNPFNKELLVDVKTEGLKIKKIELYNAVGKRMKRKRKNLKKRIRFSGDKLESGLYVLRIFTKNNGVIVRKVVKL